MRRGGRPGREGPIESGERYQPAYDDLDRAEVARRYGRYAAYREEAASNVAFWLRLIGLALIAALFLLLGAYTAAQLSTRSSARRLLERALPEVTDFDHTFAEHYTDLRAAAGSPANAGGVALPGYAIDTRVPPADVLRRSQPQLRAEMLQAAADAVYLHGASAITSGNGARLKLAGATPLSAQWTFANTLRLLSPSAHKNAVQLEKIALVLSVVVAIILYALSQGYNRAVMFGVALLVAALPLLALSALAWLVFVLFYGASADPLVAGTSDLTKSIAWFVALSYVIYVLTALALVVAGLLLERLSDIVAARRDPATRRSFAP